ncbi:MAG: hypothetical protein HC786_15780, partial [Richelia sp. CSU_2_1]|nr:hypothetical protein [Richelia sp. CSU_2_1]
MPAAGVVCGDAPYAVIDDKGVFDSDWVLLTSYQLSTVNCQLSTVNCQL